MKNFGLRWRRAEFFWMPLNFVLTKSSGNRASVPTSSVTCKLVPVRNEFVQLELTNPYSQLHRWLQHPFPGKSFKLFWPPVTLLVPATAAQQCPRAWPENLYPFPYQLFIFEKENKRLLKDKNEIRDVKPPNFFMIRQNPQKWWILWWKSHGDCGCPESNLSSFCFFPEWVKGDDATHISTDSVPVNLSNSCPLVLPQLLSFFQHEYIPLGALKDLITI